MRHYTRDGKIKPGKDIVDVMTPAEKKEYKDSLTPEGRKEIERVYPQMKSRSDAISEFAFTSYGDKRSIPACNLCCKASSLIGNFFVSEAEATYAVGCVAVCISSWTTACWPCIILGGAGVIEAYNKWRSCMDSCSCRWYRPWCCAKKAICTAAFVATLF